MPFSVLSLAVVTVASGAAFAFGWSARRAAASRQEAALKRSLYESKGTIPQLEAAVRTRDQRIEIFQLEIETVRSKLTSLETSLTQKDAEIVKRDRELRRLSTELSIAKEVDGGDRGMHPQVQLIDDGTERPPPATTPDPDARLKKAEARYEALKRGLIARDDRIAELEAALKEVPSQTSEAELDTLNRAVQGHAAELASRDAAIRTLEARVQQEAEQREQLETLARRRTETNREIKDKLLKAEQQVPKLLDTLEARAAVIAERDAAIRDFRTQLQQMTAERDARDTRIGELMQTVAARDEALKLRDARIQTQQASSQVLEQRVEALTSDLAAKAQALQHAEAVVRERDAALVAQRAKQAAVDAEAAEHELSVETLKNALRDRDFRIDTLTSDLSRASAALDAARLASAKPAQADESASAAAEANALRARIEALTRNNDRLQSEAAAAERKLVALEKERARAAERPKTAESSDGNQVRILESQLAAARLRCERAEDELLQTAREAKVLRTRVAALESGGASRADDESLADVPTLVLPTASEALGLSGARP